MPLKNLLNKLVQRLTPIAPNESAGARGGDYSRLEPRIVFSGSPIAESELADGNAAESLDAEPLDFNEAHVDFFDPNENAGEPSVRKELVFVDTGVDARRAAG